MTTDLFVDDQREAERAKLRRYISVIERELSYRRRVYPRLVVQGRMRGSEADEQIATMAELRDYLLGLLR